MSSKKKWLFVGGTVVVILFAANFSVRLYEVNTCPTRAVLPEDAFPIQEKAVHFKTAGATSQWARKYNVSCQTCHTAFPRLSYFGEQFKRNGYQMPGTRDGDETKKQVGDANLFIDNLGNLFGLRTSITPVQFNAKSLTTNGNRKSRLSFGNPNWLQLFSAGSIFKDTSIFIETEILSDRATVAFNNWMILGFHNLFDTSLLNVRVGKLSPMENFSQPGRLRMIPSIRAQVVQNVTTSGGAAAGVADRDSVPPASAQPSVEIYGYQGPVLYSVGVSNGASLSDVNKYKNFFGTLRGELQDGPLAGSNISTWGSLGWDTGNNATARQTNRFWKVASGANLRWEKFDVILAYLYGRDDNWDLATGLDQRSKGVNGQIGYMISSQWYTVLQYDWIDGTDQSNDFNYVTSALTYMPRENMRIDLIARLEAVDKTTAERQHQFGINIRSMF